MFVFLLPVLGGVHFRVAKADLRYAGHANRRFPTSVVIKQVNGSSGVTTLQKLGLFLKPYFPSVSFGATIEELAYRLHGYLIELQFYKTHSRQFHVPIPECYYSYYDYYNVRFLMIMEDLSECDNGEPEGFSPEQAFSLLSNLASLHAQFWHDTGFKADKKKLWSYGGYWLGDKEMSHHKSISESFDSTLTNFPEILEGFPEARALRHLLAKEIERITHTVHAAEPKTVIHGDYKISNIFIDMHQRPLKPYAIDWQWMGRGLCATDVAYFIYTSLSLAQNKFSLDPEAPGASPRDKKYDYYTTHEMDLLKTYYNALVKHENVQNFSFQEFEQQYAINQIYFTIFCIREKWSVMSPTNMQFFKDNRIDGLHLRNTQHMVQMLKRTAHLMQHVKLEQTPQKSGARSWKNKL